MFCITFYLGTEKEQNMKKSHLFGFCLLRVCCVALICLLMCSVWNWIGARLNKNAFVAGIFENDRYKLVVMAIDKETFDGKSGANVVEDKSRMPTNRYYEIVLLKKLNDKQYEELSFTNLKLDSPIPHFRNYRDANGNSVFLVTYRCSGDYVITYNEEQITFKIKG